MHQYRPDIDGLRAISVLLVLFFHAGIFSIHAGFIGVDIFFVISGYLITTGIQNGLEKGSFSFIGFFKRRLWRLQPVFIALLIVTAAMTSNAYLPDDYLKYTESAQFASQFRANQYFSGLETDYFAEDVGLMPLLHAWSLSIEWQWYLLLPFLAFVFYKLKVKKLLYWTFPLLIVAIIIPFYFVENRDSSAYYYSFSARIFEMLIGSCLAGIGAKGIHRIPCYIKSLIGFLCLISIGYIALSKETINLYPNWYAVIVCVSAALLIYIGQDKNLISKFLSFKPIVFIGVLSYSIYIWHWPTFAFVRNIGLKETYLITIVCILLSFIFAYASYHLVENRFRKHHTTSTLKTLLFLVVTPICLMYLLNEQNKLHEGFPNRFNSNYRAILNSDNQYENTKLTKRKCISNFKDGNSKECFIGSKSKNKALFIGDSYANHSFSFIDVLAKNKDISVSTFAYSGCLMLPNIKTTNSVDNSACYKKIEEDYQSIKNRNYSYVIISQAWSNYNYMQYPNIKLESKPNLKDTHEIIKSAIDDALKIITESGAKLIVIREVQMATKNNAYYKHYSDARSCVLSQYKLPSVNAWINEDCNFSLTKKWDKQQLFYDDLWKEMQEKYPTLIVIDMTEELQCLGGSCRADIDGYPVYSDKGAHITDYASYQFGKEYLEKYGNPFK